MTEDNLCITCKSPVDHNMKLLAYYVNSQSVYHKKCLKCMKEMYMKYKEVILKK